MSDANPMKSLIQGTGEQLNLLSVEALEQAGGFSFLDKNQDDEPGNYSGDLLFRKNPEKYRLIAGALAAGMPGAWIERTLNTSHHMISVIAQREKQYIADLSEYIGNQNRYTNKLIIERIRDSIGTVEINGVDDIQALARIADLLTKNEQLRLGGATERIEHTTGPQLLDIAAAMDALPVDADWEPETSNSSETRGSGTDSGDAAADEDKEAQK